LQGCDFFVNCTYRATRRHTHEAAVSDLAEAVQRAIRTSRINSGWLNVHARSNWQQFLAPLLSVTSEAHMTVVPTLTSLSAFSLPELRLIAGEYPYAREDAFASVKLREAQAIGAETFVDLTKENEPLRAYADALPGSHRGAREPDYHRIGLDSSSPIEIRQVQAVVDILERERDAGRTSYLHCWSGARRTCLVVACYLVRNGRSTDDAVAEVRRHFSNVSPDKVEKHACDLLKGAAELELIRAFEVLERNASRDKRRGSFSRREAREHSADVAAYEDHGIPPKLLEAIRRGRCVAFVGAGFSAPAGIPEWGGMLRGVADHSKVSVADRKHIEERLKPKRADYYEEVAQLLQRILKDEFIPELAKIVGAAKVSKVERRLQLLNGIPFNAVLTTNFDSILAGDLPTREVFGRIFDAERLGRSAHWAESLHRRPTVIKLHGDLASREGVVFSRVDYRQRLYEDPHYLNFLRSIFLYNTVLFLGSSFTDNYINELRSQTLAMLGEDRDSVPLAYAVMNDVPEQTQKHFLEVERVRVISFDTLGPNAKLNEKVKEHEAGTRFLRIRQDSGVDPLRHQSTFGARPANLRKAHSLG
jgi:hypothetical protein